MPISDRYELGGALVERSDLKIFLAKDRQNGGEVELLLLPVRTNEHTQVEGALTQIEHLKAVPGVLSVLDAGEMGGVFYLASESLGWQSLSERLAAESPLTLEESVEILKGVMSILEEIHEKGESFGSLEASTVLMHEGRIVLGRFVPRALQAGRLVNGAPEQTRVSTSGAANGFTDYRSDIYAAGALLQLLQPEGLPLILEGLVQKATAQNPAERFATICEFRDAVDDWIEQSAAPLPESTFGVVLTNGPSAGRYFPLKGKEHQIGSRSSCEIGIASIPPQVGAIVREGDGWLLRPGSGSGAEGAVLTLNGEKVSKPQMLRSGSLIGVSGNILRFLEPEEAFSVSPNVSMSRVSDESATERTLRYFGTALAVLCVLGVLWYGMQAREGQVLEHRQEVAELSREEKLVGQLVSLGDSFFRSANYRQPACAADSCRAAGGCANAEECFTKALSLQPNDLYVIGRLAQLQNLGAVASTTSGSEVAAKPKDSVDVQATLERVKELIAKEQFVTPVGASAIDLIKQILDQDEENAEAKELQMVIGAELVYRGDVSRNAAKADAMEHWYDAAEAAGVNPRYLSLLKRGENVIAHSKSEVVVFDGPEDREADSGGSYLDTAELKKRVAQLAASRKADPSPREFFDFSNGD